MGRSASSSGTGTVYLLHFLEPIGNPANKYGSAQHYVGWSPEPKTRIAEHTAGNGAKIVAAVQRRGIGFKIAAMWEGDRGLERYLKQRKDIPHICPICRGDDGPKFRGRMKGVRRLG